MSASPRAPSNQGEAPGSEAASSPPSLDSDDFAAAWPPSLSSVSAFLRGLRSGSAATSSRAGLLVSCAAAGSDSGSEAIDPPPDGASSLVPPPPPPLGGFVLLKAPAKRFQKVLLTTPATCFGSLPVKDSSPTTVPSSPVRTVSVAFFAETSP